MLVAPTSVRLKTLIWLSGLRWALDQCFEETKTELGMDHYEVRKFTGWHHHILRCMPAQFFVWHLKIGLGKKARSITPSQVGSFFDWICLFVNMTLNPRLN